MNLYQRTGGGVWWASFKGHDGNRVRRSTGVHDELAARKILADWVTEAERIRAGILPPPIPNQSIVRLLAQYASTLATMGRAKTYTTRVASYIRSLGILTTADWTSERITAALVAMRGRRQVGTVNLIRAHASAFSAWLVRQKILTANPVSGIPVFTGPSVRRRALTVAELHTLLSCQSIPRRRRLLYAVMAYTGIRRSELAGLTRANLEPSCIHLPAMLTKSGRDESIPVTPTVMAWLKSASGETFLIVSPTPTSKIFASDLARASIQATDSRGRKAVLHSLRYTYRTMLASVGASDTEARLLMRHADHSVTAGYLDESMVPLAKVVERLPVLSVA